MAPFPMQMLMGIVTEFVEMDPQISRVPADVIMHTEGFCVQHHVSRTNVTLWVQTELAQLAGSWTLREKIVL